MVQLLGQLGVFLTYAFMWEYSYNRLKLAQVLGQPGVFRGLITQGVPGVPQDPLAPPSGPRAPSLDSLKRTENPPGTPDFGCRDLWLSKSYHPTSVFLTSWRVDDILRPRRKVRVDVAAAHAAAPAHGHRCSKPAVTVWRHLRLHLRG